MWSHSNLMTSHSFPFPPKKNSTQSHVDFRTCCSSWVFSFKSFWSNSCTALGTSDWIPHHLNSSILHIGTTLHSQGMAVSSSSMPWKHPMRNLRIVSFEEKRNIVSSCRHPALWKDYSNCQNATHDDLYRFHWHSKQAIPHQENPRLHLALQLLLLLLCCTARSLLLWCLPGNKDGARWSTVACNVI